MRTRIARGFGFGFAPASTAGLLASAQNALDELQLSCYRIGNELDDDPSASGPTLEQLGDLSRFVAVTEQDLDVMRGHLREIVGAHHAGACRITDDAR